MASRSRLEVKKYRHEIKTKHRQNSNCTFCNFDNGDVLVIKELPNFYLVKNKFPYSIWDQKPVEDHLMIVPKRHTDSIAKFNQTEKIEFLDKLSEYEGQGYNVYARSPGDVTKSIIHQHTHLIRAKPKEIKYLFYLKKPYFRFTR